MMKPLAVATIAILALCLEGCSTAPGGGRLARVQSSRVRAVKSGAPTKKNVVVARRGKASGDQIQVAVGRITNYVDSLSPEDRAVATKTRYFCVCTTQATDSKGKVTCMVWDTRSQTFVGNSTFELVRPAPHPPEKEVQNVTPR